MSARKLAQAFIECTTEWDFDQLPTDVQADLTRAAQGFLDFVDPPMRALPAAPVEGDTR